jgi:hypothetical protein
MVLAYKHRQPLARWQCSSNSTQCACKRDRVYLPRAQYVGHY